MNNPNNVDTGCPQSDPGLSYNGESPRTIHMVCGDSEFWKRDPVGTCEQCLKSRKELLKYCDLAIYEI